MSVKNALLKVSLRSDSKESIEVTNTFIRISKRPDITSTFASTQDDSEWYVADFFINNVRFSAAYNDVLGEVKILSIKLEFTGVINLFNSSQDTVNGFFLAWAGSL